MSNLNAFLKRMSEINKAKTPMLKDVFEELQQQIHSILDEHTNGLSEYDLISLLRQKTPSMLSNGPLNDPESLFNVHFVLFHNLYLMRDIGLKKKLYLLNISPLKIGKEQYQPTTHHTHLSTYDELREYYLNLDHLHKTSKQDVEEMLSQFWVKFSTQDEKKKALDTLEISDQATFQDIKDRYRQLAMKEHPDRGGCPVKFNEVKEAFEILKKYHKI